MPSSRPSTDADDQLRSLDHQLREDVDRILRSTLADHRAALARIAPEAGVLLDDLALFLDGGKLLRPRLCFWAGWAVAAAEPTAAQREALAGYGAAIELVQAAALLHDDVIDHSPVRRGRPALHVQAARRHRHHSLDGDAEQFGVAQAIILGDLALSWSEQLAAGIEGAPGPREAAREQFEALRTEVMTGQFLDVLHQAGGFTSPAGAETAALEVIRWKTVPYTVLRPVGMGAALLDASPGTRKRLEAWSTQIGTAFQLRDDLLSVVGTEESTGKPPAGDILEGKRTVLLARTEQAADAEGRALLRSTVGDPGADPEQVRAVQELMLSTGAVHSVAREVHERADRAALMLEETAGLDPVGRAGLHRLADQATEVDSLLP